MSNFIKSQLSFDTIIDQKLNLYYDFIPREKFYLFFKKLNYFIGYDKDRNIASVHNDVFRKLLGKKIINKKETYIFPKLLDILIKENIIEHSSFYHNKDNPAKNYTRKYWYSDSFKYDINNTTMENIEITDTKTYNRFTKLYIRPKIKHLVEQYDLMKSERLFFDYEEALNWCIKEKELGRFNDVNSNFNKNKWNCYMSMINDLSDKNIFVFEDPDKENKESTGRVFSNLTFLKSELRHHCFIDGERLMYADLKTSQPYLFASFLKKEFPDNEEINRFFNQVITDDIYKIFYDRYIELNGDSKYTLFEPVKQTDFVKQISKDISVYKDNILDWKETRKNVKPLFYSYLFKKNQGYTPFQKVMMTDYPFIYNYVKSLKKESGAKLALSLQTLEADIFIGASKELTKLGSLTVHDSIYFKGSIKNEVNECLIKYFNKYNLTNYTLIYNFV